MAKPHSIKECPPLPEVDGMEFRHCAGLLGYLIGSDGSTWTWQQCSAYPQQP